MLHILLLILKIILWIILGALGLVLLLLLLVLFCPIKYQVEGSFQGGKTGVATVKVHYLCVSFRLHFDQAKGKLEQIIRIFGIRLGGDKKTKPKKVKEKKTKENTKKKNVKPGKTQIKDEDDLDSFDDEEWTDFVHESSDIPLIEIGTESVPEDIETTTQKDENDQNEEFDVFDDDLDRDVPKKEQKIWGRIKTFLTKIFEKIKAIYLFLGNHTPDKIAERVEAKTEKLKKKLTRLKKFWNLNCTVKTRAYLKKYIKTFFPHILPRRIKGYVHYGMAEPYKTSQVTGYLSLMPFVYKKGLIFVPDFQEKVLELDLKLKGRITLGYLLRIVLNINLWRTIRVAKKIMDK